MGECDGAGLDGGEEWDGAGVYQITNTITGEAYIGSSMELRTRRAWHLNALRRGDHPRTVLQAAWNAYGPDAFVFAVLWHHPRRHPGVFWWNVEMAIRDEERRYIRRRKPAYNGHQGRPPRQPSSTSGAGAGGDHGSPRTRTREGG